MNPLTLTPLQTKICELVLLTLAPGKHCARSAISHLKKAWLLHQTDREMSAFRALTAEEESVSAVFHSLKRVNYDGAVKLNPKRHLHKVALQPFLAAVENNLAQSKLDFLNPMLILNLDDPSPKLRTRISIPPEFGVDLPLFPDPPLNFTLSMDEKLYMFVPEILQVTNQQSIAKVVDHIKSLAEKRNQILYASTQGVPEVREIPETFYIRKRDEVFRNLALYLFIDPYPIQRFVQQALDAFLAMLGLLPKDLEDQLT